MGVLKSLRPLLLLGSVVFSTLDFTLADAPNLKTQLGDVTGLVKQVDGKDVEVFYGIPYVRAPVFGYRFGISYPIRPWGSPPRDGTVKPAACWQPKVTSFDRFEGAEMWSPGTEMSEDCLYLNVWRPAQRDGPKPIMVWIHGGGFLTGSAVLDAYEGSVLAAKYNVILVTIAYRLGAMGFFHMGGTVNGGIMDQMMAMHFVAVNAQNFGGSIDDITQFGEEAGAASIGFHLTNSFSSRLFTRAIMQSASLLSPWAAAERAVAENITSTMLENLGCEVSEQNQKLYDCILGHTAEDMTVELLKQTRKWSELPLPPVIDPPPREAMNASIIKLTDVIIGVNKNEGILNAVRSFQDNFPPEKKGKLSSRTEFRNMILTIADEDVNLQTELLKQYSRESVWKNRRLEIVDAAVGDSQYKCSVVDFAREYTKLGGRVYLYSFEENFSSNPRPDWMGVTQGSEIEVVFGAPLRENSGNSDEEKELTQKMMGLWTSFAKTGTPTFENVEWPVFTLENEEYAIIDAKGIRTGNFLRKKACDLWLAHQDPSDTEIEK